MKNKIKIGTLVLLMLFLTACGATNKQSENDGDDKIHAIATFYPMYEFTKAVLGDEGDVELLIPAGTEAHDYEPSAKSVAKMSEADAIIYNSHAFETWMDGILTTINPEKTAIIEASRHIPLLSFGEEDTHEEEHEEHEEEHTHTHDEDPHVWLSPVLAMKQVEQIRDDLIERFPAKKAELTQNTADYVAELAQLDQEYQAAFKEAKQRTFVTQHAAFSYLAKEYDLTQESMAGLSSEEEPTPKRLAELTVFILDNNIQYLYFEDNTAAKIAKTLANETNVALADLSTIESVTNAQQEQGETYLSLMKKNLESLQLSVR